LTGSQAQGGPYASSRSTGRDRECLLILDFGAVMYPAPLLLWSLHSQRMG